MKPRVLFLTNPANDAADEDQMLAAILETICEIVISHPLDCLPLLSSVEAVIIRNIWPTHEYAVEWEEIEGVIRTLKIPTYNSLTGKGDTLGKDYLITLFKAGFPVIPSTDKLADLAVFGHQEFYWIKPKDGCDGSGSAKLTEAQLYNHDLADYIIQPFVTFVAEPSFYFVDNIFSHAISMPNRLLDRDIKEYQPSKQDLSFARFFVNWNALPHGIQRVDALQLANGTLLLTEVEDLCPYLYINDLKRDTRGRFIEVIVDSIVGMLRQASEVQQAAVAL